ncbi:MAG TPA: hypothetical protein VK610_07055, partial [Rhodothermales bacterium]|nr:hypothetical protein [Rhodothermales bacterium]
MRFFSFLIILLVLAASPEIAQAQEHTCAGGAGSGDLGQLGEVVFPNSGAAAAQPAFLRGLALLHSFEYEDAALSFREAQTLDPHFAMAYWGEALSYRHPLWNEEDLEAARGALARLGPTPEARAAHAPTPRERAYMAAVEALYAEGPQPQRDRNYEAALRRLHTDYPDDDDATTLYALALVSTHYYEPPEDRRRAWVQAAALLDDVFARHPQHPGAAHYLIHSLDDAVLAPLALPAARVYADIAPSAQHALHMPSHIFLQLGHWDDVVASNEDAYAASQAWAARKGYDATERDWHSFAWLQYGYLQQGRFSEAAALMDTARVHLRPAPGEPPYRGMAFSLAFMGQQLASATGDWAALAEDALPDAGYALYVNGMIAAEVGDSARLAAITAQTRALADTLSNPAQRLRWEIVTLVFDAYGTRQRGDLPQALHMISGAADLYDGMVLSGPPQYVPRRRSWGRGCCRGDMPRRLRSPTTARSRGRRAGCRRCWAAPAPPCGWSGPTRRRSITPASSPAGTTPTLRSP